MLLGRVGFAAAGWIAADVVLLREAAGSQSAEGSELGSDGFDPALDGG